MTTLSLRDSVLSFALFTAGILVVFLQNGCALSPEAKIEALAARAGWMAADVQAGPFSLRYFRNKFQLPAAVVSVYLEGDGLPWLTPRLVAQNPTPREPIALQLMRQDPHPAFYLSRPCYQGRQSLVPCEPWLWTHGRYSEEVVRSLHAGVAALIRKYAPNAKIRLVGHSGGGVLAMLLAERLPAVIRVVTIAANLDIDAWADAKNYSRLQGSLNPAARRDLSTGVRQIHLVGGKDRQVPPELTIDAAKGLSNSSLVVFEEFDHHCCWAEYWSRLLKALDDPSTVCGADVWSEITLSCRPAQPVGRTLVGDETGYWED